MTSLIYFDDVFFADGFVPSLVHYLCRGRQRRINVIVIDAETAPLDPVLTSDAKESTFALEEATSARVIEAQNPVPLVNHVTRHSIACASCIVGLPGAHTWNTENIRAIVAAIRNGDQTVRTCYAIGQQLGGWLLIRIGGEPSSGFGFWAMVGDECDVAVISNFGRIHKIETHQEGPIIEQVPRTVIFKAETTRLLDVWRFLDGPTDGVYVLCASEFERLYEGFMGGVNAPSVQDHIKRLGVVDPLGPPALSVYRISNQVGFVDAVKLSSELGLPAVVIRGRGSVADLEKFGPQAFLSSVVQLRAMAALLGDCAVMNIAGDRSKYGVLVSSRRESLAALISWMNGNASAKSECWLS